MSATLPPLKLPTRAITKRAYLTILFSDMTASTQITASLEAEDYAFLVATMRAVFDQIIPRHGGTVVQVVGDGVLASFGYPDAKEDDGRRATEAALDLHAAVRDLDLGISFPVPLRMHSGIHAGLVLLEEGDSVTGTLKLVGNAVNVASRLSSVAESDEIIVSTETLGSDRHFYTVDDVRTHHLKGVDGPVAAHKVLGRSGVGTRFDAREKAGLTPFIARQSELDALKDALDETLEGNFSFVTIAAPPGLGKTRLAREFLTEVVPPHVRVLRGYCESYLGSEPLQPFLQIVRNLCGIDEKMKREDAVEAVGATITSLHPDLTQYIEIFTRALSLTDAAGETGKTIFKPALRLFEQLAKRTPLVLFIDDWQWADNISREIFEGLRKLNHPIMVLTTSRTDPNEQLDRSLGRTFIRTVELAPLANKDLDRSIAHLLPSINQFLVEQIRDFAGGNPLFLEELCRAASAEQSSSISPTLTGEAWLGALIVARVETLPKAAAEIVRIAAIIGNVVPISMLEALGDGKLDDHIVHILAQNDLLHTDDQPGRLRFKHGIAREVIYESVGLHQRRSLHLRIAEMLQQSVPDRANDGIVEALAYHHLAGRDFPKAAHYAELAGNKAVAALALDRGRKQYIAALQAIDKLDAGPGTYALWMSVVRKLSPLCVFDPHPSQVQHLERAVEFAQDQNDEMGAALAFYWLGYLNYALGKGTEATRHLEQALSAARNQNEPRLERLCESTLGQAYAASCVYHEAAKLLDKSIGTALTPNDSKAVAASAAYSAAIRGSIFGDQGRFEEADACFNQADAIISEAPEGFISGSIMLWKGAVANFQGRWTLARNETSNALRMANRIKSTLHLGRGTTQLGYIDWKSEAKEEALQSIEDGTSWLKANSVRLFISLDYGWLAEGMLAQRKFDRVRHFAAMALWRARAGDRLGEAMACRAMAHVAAAGHSRKLPEEYLLIADQSAKLRQSEREHTLNDLCRVEILLSSNERNQAIDMLGSVEPRLKGMGMNWHAERARNLI
jgi:class 3 adenylate cyclase/tetratricopeptide (TPR) repeat protein